MLLNYFGGNVSGKRETLYFGNFSCRRYKENYQNFRKGISRISRLMRLLKNFRYFKEISSKKWWWNFRKLTEIINNLGEILPTTWEWYKYIPRKYYECFK